MKLFLDGQEIQPDRPTIGGAIAAGRRAAEATGRLVVEAWLDGELVGDELLDHGAEVDRTGAEIRLTSAEPRALLLTTFLDIAEALEAARDVQRSAAEEVQAGSVDRGLGRLAEALAIWEQARQVVATGCPLAGISLDEPVLDGAGTARAAAESLTGHLAEVKRSIESQDWVGLTDAVMYDLDEQAESWQRLLRALADRVRSGQRGAGPAGE